MCITNTVFVTMNILAILPFEPLFIAKRQSMYKPDKHMFVNNESQQNLLTSFIDNDEMKMEARNEVDLSESEMILFEANPCRFGCEFSGFRDGMI